MGELPSFDDDDGNGGGGGYADSNPSRTADDSEFSFGFEDNVEESAYPPSDSNNDGSNMNRNDEGHTNNGGDMEDSDNSKDMDFVPKSNFPRQPPPSSSGRRYEKRPPLNPTRSLPFFLFLFFSLSL
jgi:hypothetical protein